MSCEICGRGACCRSFHSLIAQKEFDERNELLDKLTAKIGVDQAHYKLTHWNRLDNSQLKSILNS